MSIATFRSAGLVLAGQGAIAEIGPQARRLGGSKVLILTDPGVQAAGLADRVKDLLEEVGIAAEVFAEVQPEPPLDNFERCLAAAKARDYGLFVGLGGGSSMDMSKAVSIMMTNPGAISDYFGVDKVQNPGLPRIAVPTTSGTGSEVTPIAILTDPAQELKIGVVSPFLIPQVAIVDPELTLSLPPQITAATGLDALTHAIEGFTSLKANSISDALAMQAITLIARSLRTAVSNGADIQARTDMSMGSLLAGLAFANSSVTATHALAFPLGGKFDLPHGIANGLMLPYVMRFNCIGNLPKFALIARLLGESVEVMSLRDAAGWAADAVEQLAFDLGLPLRLHEVGIPEAAVPDLAASAITVTRILSNNPRQMTLEDIENIYYQAL